MTEELFAGEGAVPSDGVIKKSKEQCQDHVENQISVLKYSLESFENGEAFDQHGVKLFTEEKQCNSCNDKNDKYCRIGK